MPAFPRGHRCVNTAESTRLLAHRASACCVPWTRPCQLYDRFESGSLTADAIWVWRLRSPPVYGFMRTNTL